LETRCRSNRVDPQTLDNLGGGGWGGRGVGGVGGGGGGGGGGGVGLGGGGGGVGGGGGGGGGLPKVADALSGRSALGIAMMFTPGQYGSASRRECVPRVHGRAGTTEDGRGARGRVGG